VRAELKRVMVRVDAMTLRERVMLFVCVLVALGALTYVLFVMPLAAAQKQRAAQIDQSSAQMEALRDQAQVGMLEGRRTRAAQLQAETASLQGEIDATEREIAALSDGAGKAASLPAMLKRVVKRTDKVALVRVVSSSSEAGAAPQPGVAGVAGDGLDITLAGRYLDLMEYLAALEAAMPQAHWSSLRLTAETVPPQLIVRMVNPQGRP